MDLEIVDIADHDKDAILRWFSSFLEEHFHWWKQAFDRNMNIRPDSGDRQWEMFQDAVVDSSQFARVARFENRAVGVI